MRNLLLIALASLFIIGIGAISYNDTINRVETIYQETDEYIIRNDNRTIVAGYRIVRL
jgi:hypothetical protein